MSGSTPDLSDIFRKIDTDNDNFISRADLENSPYAQQLFASNENSLKVFANAHDNKINFSDFSLLYHAHTLSGTVPAVVEAVNAKFNAAKFLDKYLSVSAPGAVDAILKQSYIKLLASSEEAGAKHQHSIGIELGVDKPLQQDKILYLTKVLGHNLHEVFLLLKFKFKSEAKGEEFAKKLENLISQFISLLKQLASQLAELLALLKVVCLYRDGYIYLLVEIDHPFVDGIISFVNQVIQSLSPKPTLKFKVKLVSTLKDLLKESFDYKKSSGEISVELDVDSQTLHKLKNMLGDKLLEEQPPPPGALFALLFEQLRLSAEFSNLGEALSSTFNEDANSFPKPYDYVQDVKGLQIKQTLNQFSDGFFGQLVNDLQENGQFEGELSINFRDLYLRIDFDLDVEQAFDLL